MSEIGKIIRAWADAWRRDDLDAFLAIVHPEIELYLPRSAIEGTVYRGMEGAARAFADGQATWERIETLAETEVRQAAGDWHLTVTRARLTPAGSGPPVEYDAWWLFRLSGGKVIYVHPYQDADEAMAAFERKAAPAARGSGQKNGPPGHQGGGTRRA